MIKPTGFHVLIEMEAVEKTTAGGIIIATHSEHAREQGGHDVGTVLALGPTVHMGYEGCDGATSEERAAQWGYKIGDKVQFDRYQGKLLDIEGYENHRVIVDVNIIAAIGD